jgi:hypothetical protein
MLVGVLYYALAASWKPGQSTTIFYAIEVFFKSWNILKRQLENKETHALIPYFRFKLLQWTATLFTICLSLSSQSVL